MQNHGMLFSTLILIIGELLKIGMSLKWPLRFPAQVYEMPMNVETWTIGFDDLTNSSASIGFIWEKTYAAVTFEVPTASKVAASIDQVMSGPTANDYYAAAVYNLSEGKDLDKAMM